MGRNGRSSERLLQRFAKNRQNSQCRNISRKLEKNSFKYIIKKYIKIIRLSAIVTELTYTNSTEENILQSYQTFTLFKKHMECSHLNNPINKYIAYFQITAQTLVNSLSIMVRPQY